MDYILAHCEPKTVFRYFEEISRIPRGSGNEKAVSDYIAAFARGLGLPVVQDTAYNLVIRKPGTSGYENAPTVIIQGHMDMVCEKNKGTQHDFLKDPIRLVLDGDFIRADGTTLGGDNGVAIAYAMALLASADISHPPLEVLLTTDEEVGMGGAAAIDPSLLTGRILINIDTDQEGVFDVSCAGGMRCATKFAFQQEPVPQGLVAISIFIKGLKGGHSGMEIHKERGNANRILGRVLYSLLKQFDLRLAHISGGAKDNAIPREAEAILLIKPEDMAGITAETAELEQSLRHEYRTPDPNLQITVSLAQEAGDTAFEMKALPIIAAALNLTPTGIQHRSLEIEDLVETSSNIGIIRTEGHEIVVTCSLRSSVISRKYDLENRLKLLAAVLGGTMTSIGDYPAWEYNPESPLRDLLIKTFTEMYHKEPVVEAIHAGLECGLFAEKWPGIDMISFGPDILDVHTPEERMSIPSIHRTWNFLQAVLAKIR